MKTSVWATALLVLVCGQAFAVNKCTAPGGKVTYQTPACPSTGSGQVLNPGRPVVLPDPERLSPIKTNNQADSFAPAVPPNASTAPAASPLDGEAQMCLNFIKPMLKDPGSPYVQDVRKEGTVLSMSLYAKNTYGGYTSKAASCEIKNSQLDVGWTNIHLKRLGWFTD
ncbi:hypothetical protein [Rhodoferax sp.]|uniref:hypothetical protein n=1 Tax=Rhodoferax sp. TaxID=50421 RepID=UPI0025E3B39F|nr:hypothetical protein [Rhodoferax sp.]